MPGLFHAPLLATLRPVSVVVLGALLCGGLHACARGAGGHPDAGGSPQPNPPDAGGLVDDAGGLTDAGSDPGNAPDGAMPGEGPPDDAGPPPRDARVDDAFVPPEEPDAGSPEPDAGMPQSSCVPGTYVGMFAGEIKVFGFISLPIEGDVSINVETSDTGDSLTIENGRIMGTDQDGNPVEADVVGEMDCVTNQLEGGRLLNGRYTRQSLGMTVEFDGTIAAVYHPGDTPSVTGTWATDGGFIEQGAGTFSAILER